jgi:hypothetical protein
MIPQKVKAVADAVLYEGFLLFPYKPSALKNRQPWQFGVLMPQNYADASEPHDFETQLLCTGATSRIHVWARFLQIEDSPVEREVPLHVSAGAAQAQTAFAFGEVRGTVRVTIRNDGDFRRITIRLENLSRTHEGASRNDALRGALVGAHAIVLTQDGALVSLLDPLPEATSAAARCTNARVFPVLAGEVLDPEKHTSRVALASPIILYDFPAIAQASRAQTFDATEIDELLMLTVASLTDEEKREARGAHPYARELVERAEALDADTQSMLHGELTGGIGSPGNETVSIGGTPVTRGSLVRVHPRGRADVWDDIVKGMTGRVCAVHTDFEGQRYVGVVFDGDPAGDLHEWYGRSFFYAPEEIEPLEATS